MPERAALTKTWPLTMAASSVDLNGNEVDTSEDEEEEDEEDEAGDEEEEESNDEVSNFTYLCSYVMSLNRFCGRES